MDKFPNDFSRATCNDIMIKKQNELIRSVRKDFFDQIIKGVNECEQSITLVFPNKLWHEHKKTLISELLEKFGKIKLTNITTQCNVTKLTDTINDIPYGVTKITIDFINNE